MKVCTQCGEEKELAQFSKSKKGDTNGLRAYCKSCASIKSKTWWAENSTRISESRRGIKNKIQNLKANYGMSVEEFSSMVQAQNNKCAICGEVFTDIPHVDHSHATGDVRGLLCRSCNVGLGNFKDSLPALNNAIKYLQKAAMQGRVM